MLLGAGAGALRRGSGGIGALPLQPVRKTRSSESGTLTSSSGTATSTTGSGRHITMSAVHKLGAQQRRLYSVSAASNTLPGSPAPASPLAIAGSPATCATGLTSDGADDDDDDADSSSSGDGGSMYPMPTQSPPSRHDDDYDTP